MKLTGKCIWNRADQGAPFQPQILKRHDLREHIQSAVCELAAVTIKFLQRSKLCHGVRQCTFESVARNVYFGEVRAGANYGCVLGVEYVCDLTHQNWAVASTRISTLVGAIFPTEAAHRIEQLDPRVALGRHEAGGPAGTIAWYTDGRARSSGAIGAEIAQIGPFREWAFKSVMITVFLWGVGIL